MDEVVSESMAAPRVYTLLLGVFAALALALAAGGLYGLVSYTVSQRTHEMGVRLALGAAPGEIARLVLRQGVGLALGGIAIGMGGAVAATRTLVSLTRGVEPNDPAPFVAVALLLLIVAVGASCLPARRAARVDPMSALRAD